jgi:hypothetical protein
LIEIAPRYSDSLEGYSSKPAYKEESFEISGKSAKIISFYNPDVAFAYQSAVYWTDVGAGEDTHLGMSGNFQTETSREVWMRIVLSTELSEH